MEKFVHASFGLLFQPKHNVRFREKVTVLIVTVLLTVAGFSWIGGLI